MSIRSSREFEKLQEIGRIVAKALQAMSAAVAPGITTAELDEIGGRVLAEHGAESAPPKVYGFPAAVCISVNEEAIHGIPGARVVQAGDLVKLDLVAEKDGFFADAAVSVAVPPVHEDAMKLTHCAQRAFQHGARMARAGNRVNDIGRAVEREARSSGFQVIRSLGGHGVGRTIHEAPSVPNYDDRRCTSRLTEGLVLTIEPILSAGNGSHKVLPDGWTVATADGALAAHYEHTVVITRGNPVLLTAI
jgi:methionyl aminopeptidase